MKYPATIKYLELVFRIEKVRSELSMVWEMVSPGVSGPAVGHGASCTGCMYQGSSLSSGWNTAAQPTQPVT